MQSVFFCFRQLVNVCSYSFGAERIIFYAVTVWALGGINSLSSCSFRPGWNFFCKIYKFFARAVCHVYTFSRREHLSACQHSVFSAETSKSEADVSEYCVTVSGDDAEFIKSRGS